MTNNIGGIVYSPQEASALTAKLVEELQSRKEYDGITSGIIDLDQFMLPLRGPILATVIAYTSWGKSSLLNHYARRALEKCEEGECVVKCTWELSVEEDTLYWMTAESGVSISTIARGNVGEDDWKVLKKSYVDRAVKPLWIVGHSSVESASSKKIRPRMTMTNVMQACEFIMEHATQSDNKIKFVLLDYLQRIRPDPHDGETRRMQMAEAVNKAKDLGIALGCPVMLAVQSKRDVLDRADKVPRIDDGQETSNIEQSSQVSMSMWYPIKTEREGDVIYINGQPYTVNKNLMVVCLLKQTFGPAPVVLPVYFEPETKQFRSMARF